MRKFNRTHIWVSSVVLGIVVLVGVFYTGLFVGTLQATADLQEPDRGDVINQNRFFNKSDQVDFDTFWEVWDLVQEIYYRPIREEDLYYGAMEGMLWSLGDPYSVFFSPEAAEEFANELDGVFYGIGAEIGKKEETIVVIAPLSGSPAEQAGVRAGDEIWYVDDQDIYGYSVNEAV